MSSTLFPNPVGSLTAFATRTHAESWPLQRNGFSFADGLGVFDQVPWLCGLIRMNKNHQSTYHWLQDVCSPFCLKRLNFLEFCVSFVLSLGYFPLDLLHFKSFRFFSKFGLLNCVAFFWLGDLSVRSRNSRVCPSPAGLPFRVSPASGCDVCMFGTSGSN